MLGNLLVNSPGSTGVELPKHRFAAERLTPAATVFSIFVMFGVFFVALSFGSGQILASGGLEVFKVRSAPAALVMIDEPGCPYCAKWRREIGVGYANSSEGKFAPLITFDISDVETDSFDRVIYTPTFIVVAKGKEVGRITGYPGAAFFYPLLDKILAKIGYRDDPADPGDLQRSTSVAQ